VKPTGVQSWVIPDGLRAAPTAVVESAYHNPPTIFAGADPGHIDRMLGRLRTKLMGLDPLEAQDPALARKLVVVALAGTPTARQRRAYEALLARHLGA
jgi:hypothetical protein